LQGDEQAFFSGLFQQQKRHPKVPFFFRRLVYAAFTFKRQACSSGSV